jgi:hypothetical protein
MASCSPTFGGSSIHTRCVLAAIRTFNSMQSSNTDPALYVKSALPVADLPHDLQFSEALFLTLPA